MDRLAGRVCVVNGAASVIGQAVAGRFASEGGVVVGVDQVEHSVGQLAVQADLADEAQVEAMYEQVAGEYGRLDVIYNNMGLMDPGDRSARTETGPNPAWLLEGAHRGHISARSAEALRTAEIAAPDSGFITAAALPLDGGITEAFTVPD